ncbi:MAG: hypothetical protein AVDCRST_MAG40-2985 [uncultured Gemmatimonadaceae bacterium]|uniref:Uncharacterized protein n=1 Tax=uncultured Gemmatimonadaceae bacterium TaxID=246130 RepID=A0A6J4MAG8_9BACT|nr:MAG: hypothetical protein AVDCRST_MAG40-2985 [uncultured Gemmatimonadaceae bacterium]
MPVSTPAARRAALAVLAAVAAAGCRDATGLRPVSATVAGHRYAMLVLNGDTLPVEQAPPPGSGGRFSIIADTLTFLTDGTFREVFITVYTPLDGRPPTTTRGGPSPGQYTQSGDTVTMRYDPTTPAIATRGRLVGGTLTMGPANFANVYRQLR